jgi:Uma2 family endonuclease
MRAARTRASFDLMASSSLPAPPRDPADADQRIIMDGLDWWQFETMLAIRGDRSGIRFTYLEGQLEIMSPSRSHEAIKKLIARLLEAYAIEKGLVLEGYGSMTMRNPPARRGIEPDECYAIGSPKETPDLAIEVIWTRGGLDKLDVYRKLGVREVWIWQSEKLLPHALRGERYVGIDGSEVLPDLDLTLIERCLEHETQTEAVLAFLAALRGQSA